MFLIGLSRVYLGAHFPHQVLAGWLAGAVLLALFLLLAPRFEDWMKSRPLNQQLAVAFGVPVLMAIVYPHSDTVASAAVKGLDRRIDDLKSKRDRSQRRAKLIRFEREEDGSLHQHWQPSHRWRKYNQALDKLYRQRREQTKSYLYTVANALCREYDVIALGDYTPRGGGLNTGMCRAMNNQSLIGLFKQTMAWVAQKSGKRYLEYNERGTTRG